MVPAYNVNNNVCTSMYVYTIYRYTTPVRSRVKYYTMYVYKQ